MFLIFTKRNVDSACEIAILDWMMGKNYVVSGSSLGVLYTQSCLMVVDYVVVARTGFLFFWTYYSAKGHRPLQHLVEYAKNVKEKCWESYGINIITYGLNISGIGSKRVRCYTL